MHALALTLDLDGPSDYARVHGLATIEPSEVMYGEPLTRFAELCRMAGGVGTLFAIGRDVQAFAGARSALLHLHQQGFEVANHSFAHDYHLTERPVEALKTDLERSQEVLAQALGTRPIGFRAPGHTQSSSLMDALEALGFRYDSSVLPSPLYHGAKALVLALYRVLGRSSGAMPASWRMARAPHVPYHPGADPYAPGSRDLLELPISAPWGFPVTGAALALAPRALRHALTRALVREAVIVLNFHALDFADATTMPTSLLRRQPELRLPFAARMARFTEVVGAVQRGREVLSCSGLADRYAGAHQRQA